MKDPWENRVRPDLKHITSLFENEVLGAFMSGHLVIESILVQMLETQPKESDGGRYFEWSFRRKVDASESRGIIGKGTADFLRGLNDVRNRLAHKLDTPITFGEAFELAKLAARGGIDFSDETIYLDREKSEKWYGIEGIIQEVFQNAAQDLLYFLGDDSYIVEFVSAKDS
ncbi:hypothetical protein A1353_21585 [Methylomonas methanica]|uniref:Uncharacterized protein n=1 Tax=Methylomonas methanica TaxID=421 RepID=A0A177M1I3_METMH|nr:hypothetical protein [Methylomonas methanica]OAH98969.1 hypothetical protein A1353_21585 [Methylomonas methanica]